MTRSPSRQARLYTSPSADLLRHWRAKGYPVPLAAIREAQREGREADLAAQLARVEDLLRRTLEHPAP